MPAENNDNLYRMTVQGHTPGGEKWVNVFHLLQAVEDDSTLTLAIATAIRDRFATFYNAIKAQQHENYGVDMFVVKNLQTGHDGEQFEIPPATAIAGGSTTDPLPSQDAIVVSWKTALAGRKFRGRTYLAGWSTAALETANPTLDPANVTLIGNAARALLTGLSTDFHDLVVWSRIEPPTGGTPTPINNVRVGRVFDTQRRRRNKFNEAYQSF